MIWLCSCGFPACGLASPRGSKKVQKQACLQCLCNVSGGRASGLLKTKWQLQIHVQCLVSDFSISDFSVKWFIYTVNNSYFTFEINTNNATQWVSSNRILSLAVMSHAYRNFFFFHVRADWMLQWLTITFYHLSLSSLVQSVTTGRTANPVSWASWLLTSVPIS